MALDSNLFIQKIILDWKNIPSFDEYPFNINIIKNFDEIIRIFNEHNEMKIRRGFFTKCNDNLSYFYTDNSFAYFFAKMAISNECPDNLGKDLLYMMQNFSFPYKYIIRGSLDNEKK